MPDIQKIEDLEDWPLVSTGDPVELPVLFLDDYYVVVHKPEGLLVHRSPLARDAETAALQIVRDQLGKHLYPVHRLDRPTSGLLLFALTPPAATAMMQKLDRHEMTKRYSCLVRGWVEAPHTETSPLDKNQVYPKNQAAAAIPKLQDAITEFFPERWYELPYPVKPHETSRYTLMQAEPKTGRTHQIRRHLARISHPIIGDTRYGDGTHNQLFRDHLDCNRLLLAARHLKFEHPFTREIMEIHCPLAASFTNLLDRIAVFQRSAENPK